MDNESSSPRLKDLMEKKKYENSVNRLVVLLLLFVVGKLSSS